MKLFLSSTSAALPLLKSRLPRKGRVNRVLFIPNAADTSPGDKTWVDADRYEFVKMKCNVTDCDLRTVEEDEFMSMLAVSDIIHLAGGSILYLMGLLRRRKFDDLIVNRVKRGKILYSGCSAGSMILAPNLSLCQYDDDEEAELAKNMADLRGLGLVDFLLMPHSNQPDFIQYAHRMILHLPDEPIPMVFIDDRQAVWVEDGKLEIL